MILTIIILGAIVALGAIEGSRLIVRGHVRALRAVMDVPRVEDLAQVVVPNPNGKQF